MSPSRSEKSHQELYAERLRRAKDAAALRVPDRVPVFGPYQKYPYTFAGVTFKETIRNTATIAKPWDGG